MHYNVYIYGNDWKTRTDPKCSDGTPTYDYILYYFFQIHIEQRYFKFKFALLCTIRPCFYKKNIFAKYEITKTNFPFKNELL